jgi:protein-L-isoaspartate O-methyltransferase
MRVTTTPDVTQVTTGHGNRSGVLAKAGKNVFTTSSTLPRTAHRSP